MALRLGKTLWVGDGGGGKGAFSAGAIKRACESNIPMDKALGVSVNTLNFSEYIASGNTTGLEKNWRNLERAGKNALFDRRDIKWRFASKNSIFTDAGLKNLIYGKPKKNPKDVEILGIDAKALVTSPIEFQFAVYKETKEGHLYTLISNHEERFMENPELILPFLQASCSFGGAMPPVKIDGEYYSDGLYPTLETKLADGCDTIIIFLNDQPITADPETTMWYNRIMNPFDSAHDRVMEKEVKDFLKEHKDFTLVDGKSPLPLAKRIMSFFTSFVQGEDLNLVPHRIIQVAPKKVISGLTTLGFEPGNITEAIEHGYECMDEILKDLDK